jgi:GNAT superfamily N-acetyltransferase
MECIVEQAFDTEIFGVPFFRIVSLNLPVLAEELSALLGRRPIIVDAKVPAAAHEAAGFLHRLGFRTVCTQIGLSHRLRSVPENPPWVAFASRMDISDATIRAHVDNFRSDRFSLDVRIDPAARDDLYRAWIRNSTGGHAQLALHDANFCSFKEGLDGLTIDLLSVLDKRRGIGRNLVGAVLGLAFSRGMRTVQVITECGNEAAWRLYLRCGFEVSGFMNCLHFVEP